MSKATTKHFSVRQCHDEDPPICGDFGGVVYTPEETTCEYCLKKVADLGRRALARAFELDYFDVPKEPPRAHDSDV